MDKELYKIAAKACADVYLDNFDLGSTEYKLSIVKYKKIYRVVLGPYNSKSVAETNKKKVIQSGHYDVFITKR